MKVNNLTYKDKQKVVLVYDSGRINKDDNDYLCIGWIDKETKDTNVAEEVSFEQLQAIKKYASRINTF